MPKIAIDLFFMTWIKLGYVFFSFKRNEINDLCGLIHINYL